MARIPCPNCGRLFTPCTADVPHWAWRKNACSRECWEEYQRKVLEERRRARGE